MEKKNTLTEIKKGQTGRGLLIEQDGYMCLEESDRKTLKEAIGENGAGAWHCPSPFIVSAVFQKYGIENHNGRIYPEDILKREVEKYQLKIQEKRAYGECYRPEAQIKTESGWKRLDEVKIGEKVLTLNPKTNVAEYQPLIGMLNRTSKSLMKVKGEYIDDLVTPTHVYVLFNDADKYAGTANAVRLAHWKPSNLFIPCGEENPFETKESLANIECEMVNDYDGPVCCPEVENHVWYVKDNGKCHWTKNCNHPDDSVIDLGRVCMNIVELHWEQHTLVGKIEIITSEAFRRSGIICCLGDTVANLLLSGLKIGVSSRAVGSVEQRFGKMIVGDDLELICWDVVSDPSTPNAWISEDPKESALYVENASKEGEKLLEDLSKFDSWLGLND